MKKKDFLKAKQNSKNKTDRYMVKKTNNYWKKLKKCKDEKTEKKVSQVGKRLKKQNKREKGNKEKGSNEKY